MLSLFYNIESTVKHFFLRHPVVLFYDWMFRQSCLKALPVFWKRDTFMLEYILSYWETRIVIIDFFINGKTLHRDENTRQGMCKSLLNCRGRRGICLRF